MGDNKWTPGAVRRRILEVLKENADWQTLSTIHNRMPSCSKTVTRNALQQMAMDGTLEQDLAGGHTAYRYNLAMDVNRFINASR